MARTIAIFDEAQRREFDRPPKFTYSQRNRVAGAILLYPAGLGGGTSA